MHIVLTGGGTAGHVVPNLAIADAIFADIRPEAQRRVSVKEGVSAITKNQKRSFVRLTYLGSCHGIERELVRRANEQAEQAEQRGQIKQGGLSRQAGQNKLSRQNKQAGMSRQIDFHCVATGKLRRYFSMQNFLDLFRVPLGIFQAYFKLRSLKPDLIFSKGGFVGFPVVVAGWLRRIPVIIHESDAIPGLATKLSARFAEKILLGYKEAAFELKKYDRVIDGARKGDHKDGNHNAGAHKIQFTGNPVRKEIFTGSATRAKQLTGFTGKKPVLLVMGGSSGAAQLNEIVKKEKERLTEIFDIVHITGGGKDASNYGEKNIERKDSTERKSATVRKDAAERKSATERKDSVSYFQVPYLHGELKDIYRFASAAISRAGANTLAELEAIQLPTLLYPLGRYASRGDQLANTQAMCRKHNFFLLADEAKEAHTQLLLLPKREAVKGGPATGVADTKAANMTANATVDPDPTVDTAKQIAKLLLDTLQKPKN